MYLCSYCHKEYKPDSCQRFNIRWGITKNPVCDRKCQTLKRIQVEYEKKSISLLSMQEDNKN